MNINRLVLASTSRFRIALLAQSGIEVDAATPQCEEDAILGQTPALTAQARAEAKAMSIVKPDFSCIVIGADQVLEFQGETFGKVSQLSEARAMLMRLSGQTHSLLSVVSLAYYEQSHAQPRLLASRLVAAQMTMRHLTLAEIDRYLESAEWQGCAGCYQYENRGIHLFESVQGEQSTIMGLPLIALLDMLRSYGINPLLSPRGPWPPQMPS